jgi:hypothetical protein
LIAEHDFGYVGSGNPEDTTLTGTYTPAASGYYTLDIQNKRKNGVSTSLLYNFIDIITLAPQNPMLSADGVIFSQFYPTTITYDLTAGSAYANHEYWMWVGFTQTYPGINLSGVNIPLNYDLLVEMCLRYPGIPGSGFLGQLDGNGDAEASLFWKPTADLKGATLYMTYVVLSPGGKLPVLAASNPVNATAVPMQ